ncbi:hypothetical protein C4901_07550 [Acidiferrobacter sp. SPIII_3]|jgi:ABC-2 type transport system permease protein|uniref:ABC transporter permease n=1 Tax=Acidiferrobacter sp. SPIII_3 TaxID=1281578 RepID=UPI000D728CD3|nr:ABC-2 family transporter protein [Acidiferrobacter sp. SPIII_3]AWP23202.1 hypothetical protein C4901_07550 [Acidiferrobacter sp. SPIII_3]
MKDWKRWISLYVRLIFLHIRSQFEFPGDFWIGVLGSALKQVTGLIFLGALFAHIPAIAGWSRWQVAFLFAMILIPQGIADVAAAGPWTLRTLVSHGAFDRVLLSPAPPLLVVLTKISNFHQGAATGLLGVALVMVSSAHLHLAWDVAHAMYFGCALISGTVIVSAVNLAANSYVFWEPTPTSAVPFFVNNIAEIAKFPMSAYGKTVQFALTYIVPFAAVSYYPGRILLGKSPLNLGAFAYTLFMALATSIVAYGIWTRGLRRYQSTGH